MKLGNPLRVIASASNSEVCSSQTAAGLRLAGSPSNGRACVFLKASAREGKIAYHECGAIGQHGIVSGSPKGAAYFDQFKVSRLGAIFAEGKFVFNSVDHSDSATYWVLLGHWGVSLKDIPADGTNDAVRELANEKVFQAWSQRIHDELLRRARAAAGTPPIP